jgi:ribosomal protein S18 acetylase RimI-like enzyme
MNAQPNYKIREFRFPGDYAQTYELWQTAGPGIHTGRSDTPEEIAKKLQRDPDLFLVAEETEEINGSSQIIGTVLGGFDGRRGIVYHLAVAASHRRQGIGEALMDEIEQRLQAKGCLKSYLMVVPDNVEAADFYQKRGWGKMELWLYGKELTR